MNFNEKKTFKEFKKKYPEDYKEKVKEKSLTIDARIEMMEFLQHIKDKYDEKTDSLIALADKEIKKLKADKVDSREIPQAFIAHLQALRKLRGFSYKDLEALTSYSHTYIYRVFSGERKTLTVNLLNALAKAFEIDRYALLDFALGETVDEESLQPKGSSLEAFIESGNYTIEGREPTTEIRALINMLLTKVTDPDADLDSTVYAIGIVNAARSLNNGVND